MAHLGVSTVMGVCMLIYNGNLMKMDDLGPILGNLYLYAIELHDAEFPEALGKHVDMPKKLHFDMFFRASTWSHPCICWNLGPNRGAPSRCFDVVAGTSSFSFQKLQSQISSNSIYQIFSSSSQNCLKLSRLQ
jgi:hypothetical protein